MYLEKVTDLLDQYLVRAHPAFFGDKPEHPFSPLKPFKDIHDPIWGTNRFSWRELAIIDSPIIQRLRRIHQTGLAYYVYPATRHSRFEHSLGVVNVATRVFDALAQRYAGKFEEVANHLYDSHREERGFLDKTISRWRQELRLAALLHDTGHSLLSHASERVYSKLDLLKQAASELSEMAAANKKAGEALSYCLARTDSVSRLLARAREKLMKECDLAGEYADELDMQNVCLLIIGRARHPLLHFMGDIISSGFDADKLDYLLRDATAAGLPLRYDLERYLSTVYLQSSHLHDQVGKLERLFKQYEPVPQKYAPGSNERHPYFMSLRLRLPKRSMNTIEQITICKLMLSSYIYQHQKVRAAEGLFERLLLRVLHKWQAPTKTETGERPAMTDEEIVPLFLELDDTALYGREFLGSDDNEIRDISYRLVNRLVPRVVYEIGATAQEPEEKLLKNFFSRLGDDEDMPSVLLQLDLLIGEELMKRRTELRPSSSSNSKDPYDLKAACRRAGVWFDVPRVPTFEGMDELIGESDRGYPVLISEMFPINKWIEAYESHRLSLKVYSFSEYCSDVAEAAREALKRVTGITDHEFYRRCRRHRETT